MALINLKCNNCGGNIKMDDTKETGFCMYCGNKFMVKDELTHIVIEHNGSVDISRIQEAENLVIRAAQMVNEIENEKSTKGKSFAYGAAREKMYKISRDYIERALDLAPYNSNALNLKAKVDQLVKNFVSEQKKEDTVWDWNIVLLLFGALLLIGLFIILVTR